MYYVLTSGRHPFGSSLRRQANIETGDYSLNELTGTGKVDMLRHDIMWHLLQLLHLDKYVAMGLIKDMISNNSKFRYQYL